MITRSNLAEQLRDYQLRSQHNWALLSFFWPAQIASRGDATKAGLLSLLFLLLLSFSFVALYLRYVWVALGLVLLAILLPTSLRLVKQAKLARRRQRRMLLPLSM